MARPIKEGFDFFPFDVDFLNDRKIKELRGKFGNDGLMTYIYLLCLIYDEKGYYMPIDDGFVYVLSDDLKMSDEKIGLILNFLLNRSLFDDISFKTNKVLTSRGIQRRFQEMAKSKKRDVEVDKNFWLLKENETEGFIKVTHFGGYSGKNQSKSVKNPSKSVKNDTKEKKEKQNKIKEIKDYTDTVKKIVDEWNSLEEYGIPQVLKMTSDMPRYKKLIKILDTYSVNDVFRAIANIRESDFLQGKSGDRNWKIDFDFFVRPDKFTKTLEGGYGSGSKPVNKQDNFEQRQYNPAYLQEIINNKLED